MLKCGFAHRLAHRAIDSKRQMVNGEQLKNLLLIHLPLTVYPDTVRYASGVLHVLCG